MGGDAPRGRRHAAQLGRAATETGRSSQRVRVYGYPYARQQRASAENDVHPAAAVSDVAGHDQPSQNPQLGRSVTGRTSVIYLTGEPTLSVP